MEPAPAGCWVKRFVKIYDVPSSGRLMLRRSSSDTGRIAQRMQNLWDQTTEVARGLLAHGVKKGDRVGIWSPNRSEWVVIQYATARIGAIPVNFNPAYKTAELSYALQQSGISVTVLARACIHARQTPVSTRVYELVLSYKKSARLT